MTLPGCGRRKWKRRWPAREFRWSARSDSLGRDGRCAKAAPERRVPLAARGQVPAFGSSRFLGQRTRRDVIQEERAHAFGGLEVIEPRFQVGILVAKAI